MSSARLMDSWRASIGPPADPLQRARGLFLVLAVASAPAPALAVLLSGDIAPLNRVGVLAGLAWLTLRCLHTYRLGRMPVGGDPVDALAIALVGVGVGHPLQALTEIYAFLYFRSFYGDARRVALGLGVTLVGFLGGVALHDDPSAIGSFPVLIQVVFLAGGALVMHLLARTERTAAALSTERAMYAAAARALADGLLIYDRDGRLLFMNSALEGLLGLSAESVRGEPRQRLWERLAAQTEDVEESMRRGEVALAAAMKGQPSRYEMRLLKPRERDLQVQVFRIDGPSGLLGSGRLVRDITQERIVEQTRTDMLSMVSHEVRTPLTSLLGFTELLLDNDFPDQERREYLRIMQREGQRLKALIDDFLDLRRLESGQEDLQPLPMRIEEVVHLAVAAAGPDPRCPITIVAAPSLPPVFADPPRVQQVLANLLSNARKYSPHGGEIRVSIRETEQVVEVVVTDQGIGVPANALPRLFKTFYRVSGEATRAIAGTGLGLAICKRLVEEQDGKIWAESAGPGKGTRITFTLPVHAEGDQRSILIVEDDETLLATMAEILRGEGFVVAEAANGKEALGRIGERPPSCIILDLMMPVMDGWMFLEALSAVPAYRTIPIVVVTAVDGVGQAARNLRHLGVREVLAKPYELQALLSAIDRCLGGEALQQAS